MHRDSATTARRIEPAHCSLRLDAVVCADAYETPAADDEQKRMVGVLLLDEGSIATTD